MLFVNALIIMEGCVSILQSIQTRSSPVEAELVDVVEVTGCKETKSKGDVIMLNQNHVELLCSS